MALRKRSRLRNPRGGERDLLDGGVDTFGAGVGGAESDGVEDALEVALDHAGDLADRRTPLSG
jgi:hypothetical protein